MNRQHIQQCGLDPDLVGKKCGSGAGHTVYYYADTKVIKVPKLRWLKHQLNILTPKDAKHYLKRVGHHFDQYSVPAQVHESSEGRGYCIVQDRLSNFQNLTSDLLTKHPELMHQFADILERNQQLMKRYSFSLDFVGAEGFLRTALLPHRSKQAHLSNIVVTDEGGELKLKIIDSNIFTVGRRGESSLLRKLMNDTSTIGHLLNRWLLRFWFGKGHLKRHVR